MLYKSAVDPDLLRVLTKVMKIDELSPLRLVGGTALALQIGHRKSIDIDLFGTINYNHDIVSPFLSQIGDLQILSRSKHINIFSLDKIKLDVVDYKYPWLKELYLADNIRLAALEDIAAMKLNAIAGRGSRKDFIDLYFLLNYFSVEDLFSFYTEKFDDSNLFLVHKSLTYFVDADRDPMPVMLKDVSWTKIKSRILTISSEI